MGLEASTFISGLTPSWPISGDPKSQGDDHIRLIKSVLQSTFPNASKAIYAPQTAIVLGTSTQPIGAAQANMLFFIDTSAGGMVTTLPALGPSDSGWSCEVMKYTTDYSSMAVMPISGNIQTQFGPVASVRVGAVNMPVRFLWSGNTWFAIRHGPMIGSTINFDGPTLPPGFLVLDGTAIPGMYTELILAVGSTLRDKRGRVEAGVDTATSRLSNAMAGANGLGGVGGLDYHYLTAAQIPQHTHGISLTTGTDFPDHTHNYTAPGGNVHQDGTQAATVYYPPTTTTSGGANQRHQHSVNGNTDGGGALGNSWHPNVQPTIVVQKIIRAA